MIRRFAVVWWVLILVAGFGVLWQIRHLAAKGVVLQPKAGGVYREAVVGEIKAINPILPDNSSSSDATRLVFSGLTHFDANGRLRAGLATGWEVSADGRTYTFHLRKEVKWHDGQPFTARDVEFTIMAIQNPDTRSPLSATWKGVRVVAKDDNTVVMTLPKPYTPFINATTVGILPRHLLEGVNPSSMRVADFNQHPVGTGPYRFESLDTANDELNLVSNDEYYGGKPYIKRFMLRTYPGSQQALEAYLHRQVQGVGELRPDELGEVNKTGTMKIYEAGVPDEVGVFLHTSSGVMSDKAVRQALATATDRKQIIDQALKGQATALSSPVVAKGLVIPGGAHQPVFDPSSARQQLDQAGWVMGSDGVRQKNGQKLEIKLVTQSGSEYTQVAKIVTDQWQQVGARVHVLEVDQVSLQQSYIRPRHYDAILYGINMGGDPDVYAFWHSSQASDPGLNLSSYSSTAADKALESGRTIRDSATRAVKYRSFINTWVQDTPAVMLYTPAYLYGVDSQVHGVKIKHLVTPADRFDDVQHWSVKVRNVYR